MSVAEGEKLLLEHETLNEGATYTIVFPYRKQKIEITSKIPVIGPGRLARFDCGVEVDDNISFQELFEILEANCLNINISRSEIR